MSTNKSNAHRLMEENESPLIPKNIHDPLICHALHDVDLEIFVCKYLFVICNIFIFCKMFFNINFKE